MTEEFRERDGGSVADETFGGARLTRQAWERDAPPRLVRHLIVTATYEGTPVLTGQSVTRALENLMRESGVEPIAGTAYTTAHFIHPQHLALLDAWLSLSDAERARINNDHPRLFGAIFMAVKGSVPREQEEQARANARFGQADQSDNGLEGDVGKGQTSVRGDVADARPGDQGSD